MFYAVPEEVFDLAIPDKAKLLFAWLLGFFNTGKPVYATNAFIAARLKCEPRHVKRLLADLAGAGLIEVEVTAGFRRLIRQRTSEIIVQTEPRHPKRGGGQKCPGGGTKMSRGGDKNVPHTKINLNTETTNNPSPSPQSLENETTQGGGREKIAKDAKDERTDAERLADEAKKPLKAAQDALQEAKETGARFPYRYALKMLKDGYEGKVLTTEEKAAAEEAARQAARAAEAERKAKEAAEEAAKRKASHERFMAAAKEAVKALPADVAAAVEANEYLIDNRATTFVLLGGRDGDAWRSGFATRLAKSKCGNAWPGTLEELEAYLGGINAILYPDGKPALAPEMA